MRTDAKRFSHAQRNAVSALTGAISSLTVATCLDRDRDALTDFADEVAASRPNALRAMQALSEDIAKLQSALVTLRRVRSRVSGELAVRRPPPFPVHRPLAASLRQ